MEVKRHLVLFLVGALLLGWLSAVSLASPLDKLLTLGRHVEASPEKSYVLNEENGPWMILACSFSGEGAQEQARELVLELRKRYKLEACSYGKRFDLDKENYRGVDKYGQPQKMKYWKGSEFDEVAVMVGNYASIDESDAQETLQKLKYYRPNCLELDGSKPTVRTLAAWRLYAKFASASPEKRKKGPMAHAMLTTNPLLGKDFFVPEGLDPLVVKANKNIDHSLIDCPGKYTVQVGTFTGRVIINQREISEINSGTKRLDSRLEEAAEKAHRLTEALRLKGYDAYEFHDRSASIVTVGSFDWASKRMPDGTTQVNPAIHKTMTRFGPEQPQLGNPTGGAVLKTVVNIPLDLNPRVVQVPRQSIGAMYSRNTSTSLF